MRHTLYSYSYYIPDLLFAYRFPNIKIILNICYITYIILRYLHQLLRQKQATSMNRQITLPEQNFFLLQHEHLYNQPFSTLPNVRHSFLKSSLNNPNQLYIYSMYTSTFAQKISQTPRHISKN